MTTTTMPALGPATTPIGHATLDDLAPIGLDELVARAARQTRVDRKYVVPRALVPAILAAVADDAQVLDIDGVRDFPYRSVYLDTPDLRCYWAAGQGRRRRVKVRTRSYLADGTTWLEVKTRGPRGTTVKDRIEHPDAQAELLTGEAARFVADQVRSARVDGVDVARLRPTLATSYRRATLALGADRVTIDTDLRWTTLRRSAPAARGTDDPGPHRLGLHRPALHRPALAIVETKAGPTPTAVDRLLWRMGHRPVRMSKYGAGLAALDPDLPDLKWHRVIATRLTPTDPPTRLPADPTPERRT